MTARSNCSRSQAELGAENRQSIPSLLTKSTEASSNLLVPLVKVRFLRFSDVWAYPVLLCVGGLGLEGMKEDLKGWIGVESAGCAFCDGTRVFFFEPCFD